MMWKHQGVNGDEVMVEQENTSTSYKVMNKKKSYILNGDEVMVEHIMKVSLEHKVKNRTIQAHHVKLINKKKS